jgi:spore coat protein H
MAGVPAELTEHIRVWINGKSLGYHLLIEQPNKAFLERNKRDTKGNMYKLLWYGNGIIGKHEKKTNLQSGHNDLVEVLDGLQKTRGVEQWAFIQKHFNVEQFINYFAVNMCIQNWDGFHNNYFTYHDIGDTGQWEIYPWDEDKTWGDHDGASSAYDWYELPLTYAMNGSQPPGSIRPRGSQYGFSGWWREPGCFSGPLLANPEFRQRFLARLGEICRTAFTEEKMFPVINQMEKRLEAEIPVRAAIDRSSSDAAMAEFRENIQSLRNQVVNRRKFILAELDKLQIASGMKPQKPAGGNKKPVPR